MGTKNIVISNITTFQSEHNLELDLLRLDLIHPEISGNKWFKLKYNLLEAQKMNATKIISFGGPFSNHLHALAFAGKLLEFNTIGIVRGENVSNPTLNDCNNWGMELKFISREKYRRKNEIDFLCDLQNQYPNSHIIPEGGDNELGVKGCEEILNSIHQQYDFIICPVGTATTFVGIINTTNAKCIGMSALKNGLYLNNEIALKAKKQSWELMHEFHFGGFAKANQELFEYKNQFYKVNNIELDLVYTSKMMFGIEQLMNQKYFPDNSKILAIHTGGIQGNRGRI